MMAWIGRAFLASGILFADTSWNMDAIPVITAVHPQPAATVEIHDRANVFSRLAMRNARETLQEIHRAHLVGIRIDTVKSIGLVPIAEAARRRARSSQADQLYILVAADERDVGVIAARHGTASRLSHSQIEQLRGAFLDPLRAGHADRSLQQGLGEISIALSASATHRRDPSVGEIVLATIIAAGALALLLASRIGRWRNGPGRRSRPDSPQIIVPGPLDADLPPRPSISGSLKVEPAGKGSGVCYASGLVVWRGKGLGA